MRKKKCRSRSWERLGRGDPCIGGKRNPKMLVAETKRQGARHSPVRNAHDVPHRTFFLPIRPDRSSNELQSTARHLPDRHPLPPDHLLPLDGDHHHRLGSRPCADGLDSLSEMDERLGSVSRLRIEHLEQDVEGGVGERWVLPEEVRARVGEVVLEVCVFLRQR